MRVRAALASFLVLTGVYVGVLIWVDSTGRVFAEIPKLWSILPLLAGMSLLSYFVRYLRWRWLLLRAGSRTRFFPGLLAYLSGFAFTATPGKLGELLRIRYFVPQGVPASRVLAAFVYERVFDLLVVLMLASMAISRLDLFLLAAGFVATLVAGVAFVAFNPGWLSRAAAYLRHYRLKRPALILRVLRDGLAGCRQWLNFKDSGISLLFGIMAWGLTAASFALLLAWLGVDIPLLSALAIYPLAMLAGAASLLPGGLGSTEATVVGLLIYMGSPLGVATVAAIGIRLATLWFAIALGLCAMGVLEANRSVPEVK